jgi:F-type H+-transporting ATPase subunit b
MLKLGVFALLVAAASEGEGASHWKTILEHGVNLIILFGVLVYYLRKPLRDFLIERRGEVGHAIEEAQKKKLEAEEKYEEYAQRLAKIDEEIKSLRELVKEEGETEKEEILRHAEATAKRVREETRETIRLETERAREAIRVEAVSSAISIAEEILRRTIEERDEKRLVEDFLKEIEEESWQRSQH